MLVPGANGDGIVLCTFSCVKTGSFLPNYALEIETLPIALRRVERHNTRMRLERKDWVLLTIAILLPVVAIFQENTFLSNTFLAGAGIIISYLVWQHSDIHEGYRGLLITAIALSVIGSAYYISAVNFEKEMRRNYGKIYPSNVSMPNKTCGPGDDIVLFSGQNSFQMTETPYRFLYIDGDPIITLSRDGDAIAIDYLLLNDANGDNIVHIDKNEFWIKPSIERLMVPDRSKLVINDHSGHVALALWFLNSRQIFIAGKFVYHGFIVEIGNEGINITMPNGKHLVTLNDDCFIGHEMFITNAGLDAISRSPGATEVIVTPTP
jgi:hypothetical protein